MLIPPWVIVLLVALLQLVLTMLTHFMNG